MTSSGVIGKSGMQLYGIGWQLRINTTFGFRFPSGSVSWQHQRTGWGGGRGYADIC